MQVLFELYVAFVKTDSLKGFKNFSLNYWGYISKRAGVLTAPYSIGEDASQGQIKTHKVILQESP